MIVETKIFNIPFLLIMTLKIFPANKFLDYKNIFEDETPGDNFPAVFIK